MQGQEPEREYPLHQPRRSRNGHESRESRERHDPFDEENEDDIIERRRVVPPPRTRRTIRQEPLDEYEEEEDSIPSLPPNRLRNASIVGVITGVLISIESVIIAFANTGNYQQAGKFSSNNLPAGLALTLVGIACLTFFIGLFICFIAGFVTGKVAVQRRYGFLTGFIAGIVTYGISFLLNFIPNYPGHLPGSSTNNAGVIIGGIGVILILFLIWGIVAGLVSLFGTWVATRRHAYYVGY
jgi:hypothetical protein